MDMLNFAAASPPDLTEFGAKEIADRAFDCYQREEFDRQSWDKLAASGFWRRGVPEEFGGDGGTWRDLADGIAELARSGNDLGFMISMIAHAGLIRALAEHGNAKQRGRLLPKLMNGAVGAAALTEPSGGSDLARVGTRATRNLAGFRITGLKDHITNGPVADVIVVLGRVPELGERDITLFVVESNQAGVRRGDPEPMLGLRTSPNGSVYLDGVRVQPDAVLGEPGDGLRVVYDILSFDRLLYGVVAAAFLEPRLEEAVRHAQDRVSFGAPIIEHQYVQGRLTDIKIAIETTRALSERAMDALLANDPAASMHCSIAKLVGSEGLVQAAQHLMAVYGHMGYMRGDHTKVLQDAMGTLIAGGTPEMQRKNIMNQMIKLS